MTPNRSTFSLAQLLLLVMLTGMLCAWLPEAVKLNQRTLHEMPARQLSVLSKDAAVYYCRSGQGGFAVFDLESGKCKLSESTAWSMDVAFDPVDKRIYVRTSLPGKPRYAMRAIDPTTGQEEFASSPLPRENFQLDPLNMLRDGGVPLVHDGIVYDFLFGDGRDSSMPDSVVQLRCWHMLSGRETFCVPAGNVEQFWNDFSADRIVYVAAERSKASSGSSTLKRALFVRDAKSGLLEFSTDFTNQLHLNDGFAFCHKSPALAMSFADLQVHHSDVLHNESEIYLITPKAATPKRIAAIEGLQISQIALEGNDETIWHLGMHSNGVQVLARRNIQHGYNIRTWEVGREDSPRVTDFRLVHDDKQVALASDDGSFRILDVESGKELRRLVGLKYSPSFVQIFVLAGVAITWIVLWWWTTLQKQGGKSDFAGRLGVMIFLVGVIQGILLLHICDAVHHLHEPTVAVAVVIPSLCAIVGVVSLFNRRCNKLTTVYSILASAAMLAYTLWVAAELQ